MTVAILRANPLAITLAIILAENHGMHLVYKQVLIDRAIIIPVYVEINDGLVCCHIVIRHIYEPSFSRLPKGLLDVGCFYLLRHVPFEESFLILATNNLQKCGSDTNS